MLFLICTLNSLASPQFNSCCYREKELAEKKLEEERKARQKVEEILSDERATYHEETTALRKRIEELDSMPKVSDRDGWAYGRRQSHALFQESPRASETLRKKVEEEESQRRELQAQLDRVKEDLRRAEEDKRYSNSEYVFGKILLQLMEPRRAEDEKKRAEERLVEELRRGDAAKGEEERRLREEREKIEEERKRVGMSMPLSLTVPVVLCV